jgi:hypothetical protein
VVTASDINGKKEIKKNQQHDKHHPFTTETNKLALRNPAGG